MKETEILMIWQISTSNFKNSIDNWHRNLKISVYKPINTKIYTNLKSTGKNKPNKN
jgi:hypothetical protein